MDFQQIELTFGPKAKNSNSFVIRNDEEADYVKASVFINSSDIDILDIQHEFKIFGKPDGENINILLDNVTKPIVTTLHSVHVEQPKSREDIFHKIVVRSDLLYVFSEYAKRYIIDKHHVEGTKVMVIPHGVPSIPLNQTKRILERKFPKDDLIFVSSGHLRETKGYDIAITALNELKNSIGNFRYYIIGADHPQNETAQGYRKQLIELINGYELQEKVIFINRYISQKELIDLIQMADICLLPYPKKEQSSSGVLALMIACGRPVITTPFQFANSLMTENSGITTESFLPFDFAKGIMTLIERKNSWGEIMQYNHTLGESWNWDNVVKLYYRGYNQIF